MGFGKGVGEGGNGRGRGRGEGKGKMEREREDDKEKGKWKGRKEGGKENLSGRGNCIWRGKSRTEERKGRREIGGGSKENK